MTSTAVDIGLSLHGGFCARRLWPTSSRAEPACTWRCATPPGWPFCAWSASRCVTPLTAALLILSPAFGGADLGLLPAQDAAMRAMDAAGSRAIAEGTQVLLPLFAALPPEVQARPRGDRRP